MAGSVHDYRIRIKGDEDGSVAKITDRINARFKAWGEHTEKIAKPVKSVEKSIDAIGKSVGLDKWTRAFGGAAGQTADIASGISATATELFGMSDTVALAVGGFAAAGAAAVGVGVAANGMARSWSKSTADVVREAGDIGVSVNDLLAFKAAAEKVGVSGDAMTGSLMGIAQAAQGVMNGTNTAGLSMMQTWGLQIHKTKDGLIDVKRLALDLAKLNATLTPESQQQLAGAFGFTSAVPVFRQPIKQIQTDMQGALALTPDQIKTSLDYQRNDARLKQQTQRFGNDINADLADKFSPFIGYTGKILEKVNNRSDNYWNDEANRNRAIDTWQKQAQDKHLNNDQQAKYISDRIVDYEADLKAMRGKDPTEAWWIGQWEKAGQSKGLKNKALDKYVGDRVTDFETEMKALRAKAPPRPRSASTWDNSGGFDDFARRIENQESGFKQFGSRGQPLVSSAGAIGAMQLEPGTARQAADLLGVPFDPQRLANDQGYNEQLGRGWLKHLLDHYNGDQALAAEAYNAGSDVVDDWISGQNRSGKNRSGLRLGDPRKGEISDQDFIERTPFAETRQYAANTAIPQPIELTVRFENAPGALTTTTKAPGTNVKVRIAQAMPNSG